MGKVHRSDSEERQASENDNEQAAGQYPGPGSFREFKNRRTRMFEEGFHGGSQSGAPGHGGDKVTPGWLICFSEGL